MKNKNNTQFKLEKYQVHNLHNYCWIMINHRSSYLIVEGRK